MPINVAGLGFPAKSGAATTGIYLERVLAVARRQASVFGLCVAAALVLGLLYAITAVPQFTASTKVLIDSSKNADQLSATIAELNLDAGAIDSQVEVMKSDSVINEVIKAMRLDTDPSFIGGEKSALASASEFFTGLLNLNRFFVTRELSEEERKAQNVAAAMRKLSDNVEVKRINRTYVLSVDYTSPDPYKAMKISQAFAEAYFADQLEAKFVVTRRASGWLADRIDELKEKSLAADLAIQRFRAANGLVVVSEGRMLGDQQMSEISSQMSQARSDTEKAEARLQQINEIIRSGRMDGAVTETLGNPVVIDLRTKYLKVSKSAEELAGKLGNSHMQVISLRNEMAEYEKLIFQELQRTAKTYESEMNIARAKEKSASESMAALAGQKAASDETMVQLRQLERESNSYKTLYETFLQRYQDAIQRQSFPATEARVITPAAMPISPTKPKKLLIIILSGVLGAFAGFMVSYLREYRDRVFRVGSQVRDELGLQLIGMLPTVAIKSKTRDLNSAAPKAGETDARDVMLRYSVDAPLSSFSEVLRSAKVEIDLALGQNLKGHIVGFISVLPNEGKTTITKNFASLMAFLGAKTLLIDGDLRNPGLTKKTAAHATRGLLEVLRGDEKLEDCLLREEGTNLDVLPMVMRKRLNQSSELLASAEMESFLASARQHYDYIVIDLPPIGPVVDVRAAARLFDCFIFVVEWGKTARSIVSESLKNDLGLYDKCAGVILNKVNPQKMRLYNSYGYKGYYYNKYSKYYVEKPESSTGV